MASQLSNEKRRKLEGNAILQIMKPPDFSVCSQLCQGETIAMTRSLLVRAEPPLPTNQRRLDWLCRAIFPALLANVLEYKFFG